VRPHRGSERGGPGATARGAPLEHAARDYHLVAAAFEKLDLVLAQLAEPFGQGCQRLARREQGIEPFERAIGGREWA